ncbi:aspartyl protease family protein [Actinomadura rubrisoli]|uniref:Twin-arginine translocation signal domain-containing protein n=1 Tax=Actinomadura rubrisoli TaxID=2530368 RepID=A0A4V2YV38_9ACTN|nr:aspartyl protease family protein [Actinomadura rubrisoli]TDD79977.1 twin-arginine translocation signal domain-containing protein [Actinomadura rubrisoli]
MIPEGVDRRTFLQRSGMAIGAGAALPLLTPGTGNAAPGPSSDPDALFKAGRFDEADRGYRRLLHKDPNNARAAAQRGYIALLSNRFGTAERFLTRAVHLDPGDSFTKEQLADCHVRQDRLARAVPLLKDAGKDAYAKMYAAVAAAGTPYEIHGAQATRIPFEATDPLPTLRASVNGLKPGTFMLDTGATMSVSAETAERAGIRAVASMQAGIPGHRNTFYLGVMDSFRIGHIEIRNIPVLWAEAGAPKPPGKIPPDGVFGTTVFYHFLTTMGYANQALVLRRRTREQLRRFQARARRAGVEPLPLWLAGDHFPCTLGSLNGYGPRVVSLDTGGSGLGVVTSEENAKRAGVEIDYAHPEKFNGTITCYPIHPETSSLGAAVGRRIRGTAGPLLFDDRFKFDTLANFTHEFFKPYAITFDFADMNFYVAPRDHARAA